LTKRVNISSGTQWEDMAGYSRAVRYGDHVFVSGTTATDAGGHIVGVGDAYTQGVYILEKIEAALNEAGAQLGDVVRTRIYITDANVWQSVARAHDQFFTDIRPANTLVVVAALIGHGYLVEIEAEAIIGAHQFE
jgi:enamine deaminase RidA (YjgF/YER057c/UK114 family)